MTLTPSKIEPKRVACLNCGWKVLLENAKKYYIRYCSNCFEELPLNDDYTVRGDTLDGETIHEWPEPRKLEGDK